MELAGLVAVADEVAATSSRSAKRDALAELLRRLDPAEVEAAVGLLVGDPRQGRLGVGWATVSATAAPGVRPAAAGRSSPLTVADVDRALSQLAATSGAGSVASRHQLLVGLFDRATPAEADFLRRLLVGEMRQGALEGVMADAVARAAEVPVALVRRAAMLDGDLRHTAAVALTEGRAGLEGVGLTLFRPVQPMLAAPADDVPDALGASGPASVEWKLDGARIQVHRAGDRVAVYTRNLNDVTDRLPEVVDAVLRLPIDQVVLDGEVLGLGGEGSEVPRPFQDTMSRFGRDDPDSRQLRLRPFFFDVLSAGGDDLIDQPLAARLDVLDQAVGPLAMPRVITADVDQADAFLAATVGAGHEGVVVKALDSPYAAGRRGKAWRKLKPVHTFDLVVLAAEWGHGRRRGWLSNLHLGARADDGSGFVMVGKTFKGLTDALLGWQTDALQARQVATDGHVVHVRPELVVEVAIDGVQTSTRYPGGIALRFARVKRYRHDKEAAQADLLSTLQALRR